MWPMRRVTEYSVLESQHWLNWYYLWQCCFIASWTIWKKTFVRIDSKYNEVLHRKYIREDHLQNGGHFVQVGAPIWTHTSKSLSEHDDVIKWKHQSSALLALCAGNSPVTCEFPAQRPVTRSFDVFFDLRLNKRLSKQSWGWWFETP